MTEFEKDFFYKMIEDIVIKFSIRYVDMLYLLLRDQILHSSWINSFDNIKITGSIATLNLQSTHLKTVYNISLISKFVQTV